MKPLTQFFWSLYKIHLKLQEHERKPPDYLELKLVEEDEYISFYDSSEERHISKTVRYQVERRGGLSHRAVSNTNFD